MSHELKRVRRYERLEPTMNYLLKRTVDYNRKMGACFGLESRCWVCENAVERNQKFDYT